jgi:hypothetical protein
MIDRVKTPDLLKLNWLLKLGFPVSTHNHIIKNIYFGTLETIINQLDKLKNDELALLYYYYKIVI